MEARNELSAEFFRQHPGSHNLSASVVEKYIRIAEGYAEMEHVLAVLSILHLNESMVFYGKFSDVLDIDCKKCCGKIQSIWEDEIFNAIHPDDLDMKLMQELLFFHYINRLPKPRRFNQCLLQRLRMRGKNHEWIETLHRLYYIPAEDGKAIRFALCLYGPMTTSLTAQSSVMDTITGEQMKLDHHTAPKILSNQEVKVLKLIENGNSSKVIADMLRISVHTVNRHRQNIIAKLKVRNSAEACKIARNFALI